MENSFLISGIIYPPTMEKIFLAFSGDLKGNTILWESHALAAIAKMNFGLDCDDTS